MTNDKNDLLFERRFKNGEEYQSGMGLKDSVISDVYNKKTGDVMDYKFGNAKLGNKQKLKLEEHMPKTDLGESVNVFQVKPTN